jgi:hypothetical protein
MENQNKTAHSFTQSGTLAGGVLFDGKMHQDFTVRLSTVGDEIAVVEDGISETGQNLGVLMRCIVSLGDIPPEAITYELLCDELDMDDYRTLKAAQAEAKKKRSKQKENSETIDAQSSGSASTASAKKDSKPLTL